MNVEVIKDVGSLSIRWPNEAGDMWTVTKRFNLGSRILEDAQVRCSAETPNAGERAQADTLAEAMDRVFIRPETFDLVTMDRRPGIGGPPAQIFSRDDGRIIIATS